MGFIRTILHAMCGVWSLCLVAAAAGAAPTKVNGIDVVMDPPAGFRPATAFVGFQHVQSFSTIEVSELDAPFATIAAQISPEVFAEQDLVLAKKQALRIDGRDALLLQLLAGESAVADFNKWMLVIGDSYRSLSITAAYPSTSEEKQGGKMRDSLLTTRWLRTPQQQLFYDLPFTVVETTDLKYTRRTANMLVLADTSATGDLSSLSPSIVIGHIDSKAELVDIKEISHQQLEAMQSVEVLEVMEEGETKVDGIRAYRIVARARPRGGDVVLAFEQIIAFQLYKYLLVQSSVEEALADRYRPQFDEVVGSIGFKEAH